MFLNIDTNIFPKELLIVTQRPDANQASVFQLDLNILNAKSEKFRRLFIWRGHTSEIVDLVKCFENFATLDYYGVCVIWSYDLSTRSCSFLNRIELVKSIYWTGDCKNI